MKPRKKNRFTKTDPIKKGKRVSGKTGLPPGSLIHIGKILTDAVTVNLITFTETGITQKKVEAPDQIDIASFQNNWIEICGLHDTATIEFLGKKLAISSLILEDILNTEHRPKFDLQDGMLFLTLKAVSLSEEKEIVSEQVSFVLGRDFLVSFQESNQAWFEPVKIRLEDASGKIRQRGLDFILYSLIDVLIDQYYAVIETIGDKLEDLEELIFDNPTQELIENTRIIKKEILTIRKALIPALEAFNKLKRDDPELIGKDALRYYDDIHDHIIQILDYIDTYRELSAELRENYISNITLRMNQVIKLLTIITTIFIPLTFIAGIYGMNFQNMPELTWKYGYFYVLGFMFLITSGMLIFFRRKKWF